MPTITYPEFPSDVIGPSYPLSKNVTPRVKVASFGDGYTQQSPDGLNPILHTWSLVWNVVTYEERTTITQFFKDRKGCESFYWTDGAGTPHLVKCTTWTETNIEPTLYKIDATFKQTPI